MWNPLFHWSEFIDLLPEERRAELTHSYSDSSNCSSGLTYELKESMLSPSKQSEVLKDYT